MTDLTVENAGFFRGCAPWASWVSTVWALSGVLWKLLRRSSFGFELNWSVLHSIDGVLNSTVAETRVRAFCPECGVQSAEVLNLPDVSCVSVPRVSANRDVFNRLV